MINLTIPDMSCGGCAKAVTNIIRSVDANAGVEINIAAKSVAVSGIADSQAVLDALKAAGYPAN